MLTSYRVRACHPTVPLVPQFKNLLVKPLTVYGKNSRLGQVPIVSLDREVYVEEGSMARPKEDQPTDGELEVLKVLWDRGPSTVREVLEVLTVTRPRGLYIGHELIERHDGEGSCHPSTEGSCLHLSCKNGSRQNTKASCRSARGTGLRRIDGRSLLLIFSIRQNRRMKN